MSIIRVPFPLKDVQYQEDRQLTYRRVGFFTLSPVTSTVTLHVDFHPHSENLYDYLCVGVAIGSAETLGHLAELGIAHQCSPSLSSMGNWTRQGLTGVLDKHAFYLYKYYTVGPDLSRTLRNFTVDMKKQWDDWVIFAGVCPRTDVTLVTTEARGRIALSQSLFAPSNQIYPASSDTRLYRKADTEDTRGRKKRKLEEKQKLKEEAEKGWDEWILSI